MNQIYKDQHLQPVLVDNMCIFFNFLLNYTLCWFCTLKLFFLILYLMPNYFSDFEQGQHLMKAAIDWLATSLGPVSCYHSLILHTSLIYNSHHKSQPPGLRLACSDYTFWPPAKQTFISFALEQLKGMRSWEAVTMWSASGCHGVG